MNKIKKKSLLYKSKVEYADFSINHVEGCAHGCNFPCYAFMMSKRFGRVKSYNDWLNPKIVENALDLLDEDIKKYKEEIKFVHLSFMTDPFMYKYKEVQDLTLKIIKKLNKNSIRCTVLTKGIYPKELENKEEYGNNNEYGITLVSLDKNFKEKFEPFSAPYEKRINALRYLHDKGLKTWVSIEPYPTPNLVKQDIKKILNNIGFVDKIVFGKINYNVKSILFSDDKYKDSKQFFDECAREVLDFCDKNKIEHHIKCGTQRRYNSKTENIFDK